MSLDTNKIQSFRFFQIFPHAHCGVEIIKYLKSQRVHTSNSSQRPWYHVLQLVKAQGIHVETPATTGLVLGHRRWSLHSRSVSESGDVALSGWLPMPGGLTMCPPIAFCISTNCDAEAGKLRESNHDAILQLCLQVLHRIDAQHRSEEYAVPRHLQIDPGRRLSVDDAPPPPPDHSCRSATPRDTRTKPALDASATASRRCGRVKWRSPIKHTSCRVTARQGPPSRPPCQKRACCDLGVM